MGDVYNMRALVLAGGFPQITLIKKLKARGCYTVLADWNDEPVAKKYADKYYQVSTLDVEAIKNVAVKEKADFLITVCTDQALLTVAKVSEELNMPCYINYETALNVTNKQYMKEVFCNNGIPTAKHIIKAAITPEDISSMHFPLIVKPADCNSSKGVAKVKNFTELKEAFDFAENCSRTNTVVVEEFIEGRELSVDVYVDSGRAVVLDITNSEKIKDDNKFVINRTWHPAEINSDTKAQVEKVAQQIAEAFGIVDSPMLIQMIERDGAVFVLEFSARTGGGVKFITIKELSGFDVIDAVIDLTLGEKPKVKKAVSPCRYMIDEYIYCKPGVFDHLENFEELKNQGILFDYYLFKWRGAQFDSISSSGDRIAGFSVQADSLENLYRKQEIANKTLKVIDVNGNDIMRHDLLHLDK